MVPFSLFPSQVFIADREWTLLGTFQPLTEHITLNKGRLVLKLARMLLRDPRAQSCRVLTLQDNRPVSGAMMKGRSPAPALNYLLGKKAAACLAGDLRRILPWVEDAKMPADGASCSHDECCACLQCWISTPGVKSQQEDSGSVQARGEPVCGVDAARWLGTRRP